MKNTCLKCWGWSGGARSPPARFRFLRTGFVLGVGVGLMVAPRSGRELRHDLRKVPARSLGVGVGATSRWHVICSRTGLTRITPSTDMNFKASLKTVLVSALLAAGAFAADPKNDHKFVEEAASGGLAEVRLGQLAVDRSSDAAVKDFAQQMVADHSKANDELKSLVAGRDMMVPTELTKEQQKTWDELNKLSMQKFDKAYVDAMVDEHKKVVKLFEMEARSGDDTTLKAFASRTLPTLQHHLEMAQALQKNVKNQPASN